MGSYTQGALKWNVLTFFTYPQILKKLKLMLKIKSFQEKLWSLLWHGMLSYFENIMGLDTLIVH